MIDFASALYLGMRHASRSLRPWESLSAGVPAALEPSEGAQVVESQVAALQGREAATMGTSTLHLVWDLFRMNGTSRYAIYLDAGAYPILRWGVERAVARGVRARQFRHHDGSALARALWRDRDRGLRPLVVTDGLCPGCGSVAPLREYLELVRRGGGVVVADDTQALGILGKSPDVGAPYGRGGGGSVAWADVDSPYVVVVSSMAKGFGVPAAVLSGSRAMVEKFEATSETRVHCSPPSVASLRAAERALQINNTRGEILRARLAGLVRRFRRQLATIGLVPDGGLFPVQTISFPNESQAMQLHAHLLERGMRTVLHRGREGRGVKISVLINADHTPESVDGIANALSGELKNVVTRQGTLGRGLIAADAVGVG
jgi:8-amino-7-oxononanoate synthase